MLGYCLKLAWPIYADEYFYAPGMFQTLRTPPGAQVQRTGDALMAGADPSLVQARFGVLFATLKE